MFVTPQPRVTVGRGVTASVDDLLKMTPSSHRMRVAYPVPFLFFHSFFKIPSFIFLVPSTRNQKN